MTSPLERRVAKLEASARGADSDGAVQVAFVRPGENADEKVAALGPVRRGDQLIVVHFVRPGDVRRDGEALQ